MKLGSSWTKLVSRGALAGWLAAATMMTWTPPATAAEESPTEVTGKAILALPAGKAVVEGARLLKAGKLAEVKKASAKDVRDEWAAIPAAEQREQAARAKEMAPDPATFVAEIARAGVLTNYGDSAKLWVPSADGNSAVVAFASLEGGKWLVTAGPMTVDTTPAVETAPKIQGAAILDHEIGKQALAYATALEGGVDQAMALATAEARKKRLAASPKERGESDRYRKSTTPSASLLAGQIRTGGRVSFEGDHAFLIVTTNTQTKNADGSTSYSSSAVTIPFALENGHWRIAD